jgi:XTP/dITP diphosphohydrolase
MKKLIVATSNVGKIPELQEYLTDLAVELYLKPQELEIEETGTTFLENACLKAAQVAQALGEWSIADDSGLAVDALGGAPGVYSARYGKDDQERIDRLLRELGDSRQRQAQFICAIAIADPTGSIVITAEGKCAGEISLAPRGSNGFGYDPIFYVPSQQQTFAEMTTQVKNHLSHRGKAFQILLPRLSELQLF